MRKPDWVANPWLSQSELSVQPQLEQAKAAGEARPRAPTTAPRSRRGMEVSLEGDDPSSADARPREGGRVQSAAVCALAEADQTASGGPRAPRPEPCIAARGIDAIGVGGGAGAGASGIAAAMNVGGTMSDSSAQYAQSCACSCGGGNGSRVSCSASIACPCPMDVACDAGCVGNQSRPSVGNVASSSTATSAQRARRRWNVRLGTGGFYA